MHKMIEDGRCVAPLWHVITSVAPRGIIICMNGKKMVGLALGVASGSNFWSAAWWRGRFIQEGKL